MHTTHNTRDCCKYEDDGSDKAIFHAAKKGGKKLSPAKQSFAQLSKKFEEGDQETEHQVQEMP
jgi:hypothetical protein